MKGTLLFICIVLIGIGCKGKKQIPDVSGIQVAIKVERFEKDFFAVDTLHLNTSLAKLNITYPGFTQDFLFNILGTSPDSALKNVPEFIKSYEGLSKAALQKFNNLQGIENEIKQGFRFVHYYFPAYKLPVKLITFIGPINSYGSIITANALAVGLQLYMGKDYPIYLSEQGQQMYPLFISRRFEPAYIPVNGIKNIIDDMYPNNSNGLPLIEQMIESGKRIFVLDKLMPEIPDSIKTGYTQKQLEGCYESEKNIWSFFVQNDMLFNTDPNVTRDYMSDGPNTPALGEASPGNIGQFVGWQIVKKWMDKNVTATPDELMKKKAKEIFNESKYKPK